MKAPARSAEAGAETPRGSELQPLFVRRKEAARLLGISVTTLANKAVRREPPRVYHWGKLAYYKVAETSHSRWDRRATSRRRRQGDHHTRETPHGSGELL